MSDRTDNLRFHKLNADQLNALCNLINSPVTVQSRYAAYPTLKFPLIDFIFKLHSCFTKANIEYSSFKLNGGAASYVLDQHNAINAFVHRLEHRDQGDDMIDDPDYSDFNDIDIIISMELDDWDAIRTCAFTALHSFLPDEDHKPALTSMWDAYVSKLVRVNNENDKWSLISFTNYKSQNLELKFVQSIRRQYQFTVDSFHIHLEPFFGLLKNDDTENAKEHMRELLGGLISAESVYGNYKQAFHHLCHRLIVTRQPEEIRGGGLLRYCHLLVKGFHPEDCTEMRYFERYMCTRFFIDFNDTDRQQHRIKSYINTHLRRSSNLVIEWLRCLHAVVGSNSSQCLMNQERSRTLQLISHIALLCISQPEIYQLYSNRSLTSPSHYRRTDNESKRHGSNRRRSKFGPYFFQGGPPYILNSFGVN